MNLPILDFCYLEKGHLWQSRVEIKGYSVAYFDRIAAFKATYRWTSIKGGAHTHFIDLLAIHASTKHVWALPLTEVQRYSAWTQWSDQNTRQNSLWFLHGTATSALRKKPSNFQWSYIINSHTKCSKQCIQDINCTQSPYSTTTIPYSFPQLIPSHHWSTYKIRTWQQSHDGVKVFHVFPNGLSECCLPLGLQANKGHLQRSEFKGQNSLSNPLQRHKKALHINVVRPE